MREKLGARSPVKRGEQRSARGACVQDTHPGLQLTLHLDVPHPI